MVTVAIVGASQLTENEKRDTRQLCTTILKSYTNEITVISGGAEGVDTIAITVAKELGLKIKEFLPEVNEWIPKNGLTGFKKRNLQIVDQCDDIYCIVTKFKDKECYHHSTKLKIRHEVTAGCWTMKKAYKAHKNCKLFLARDING